MDWFIQKSLALYPTLCGLEIPGVVLKQTILRIFVACVVGFDADF